MVDDEKGNLSDIPAIILCGGFGTRLESVLAGRQKVLVDVADDEPFIGILIRYIARQGIKRFVLAAGYRADSVEALARDLSADLCVSIDVVRESQPLGTGGALKFAASRFERVAEAASEKSSEETATKTAPRFFVVNGDSLCEFDYAAMLAFHIEHRSLFTMALVEATPSSDGGFVRLLGDKIAGFQEKEFSSRHSFFNAGTYLLERAFLDRLPVDQASSLEREILPALVGEPGASLHGYRTGAILHDIGTPERLTLFRAQHARKRGGAALDNLDNLDKLSLSRLSRLSRAAPRPPGSHYVFLDRDGVINTYQRNAYVNCPDDFTFIPGVLESLAELHRRGFHVIVISNQAGVGKGLMSPANLEAITVKMRAEVEAAGGKIHDVLYCTHNTNDGCECRKPRPGMLLEAARRHGFHVDDSCFIGDAESDWLAAKAAGCRFILVLTGKTSAAEAQSWNETPSVIAGDLSGAIELLE